VTAGYHQQHEGAVPSLMVRACGRDRGALVARPRGSPVPNPPQSRTGKYDRGAGLLAVLHAPVWATLLIAIVPTLLILGIVLAIWGADEPGNTTVHAQEDEPPDTGDGARQRDVLRAA
jgi:hypothetical protein